jgi:hypothetical protein
MSSKDANPQAGKGIPLPKKETDLFRSVVKHYECKQYKKGIKSADAILKKFPKHGETLCMKGLILNCTGKREEAINMVKLGLMNDMRYVRAQHMLFCNLRVYFTYKFDSNTFIILLLLLLFLLLQNMMCFLDLMYAGMFMA